MWLCICPNQSNSAFILLQALIPKWMTRRSFCEGRCALWFVVDLIARACMRLLTCSCLAFAKMGWIYAIPLSVPVNHQTLRYFSSAWTWAEASSADATKHCGILTALRFVGLFFPTGFHLKTKNDCFKYWLLRSFQKGFVLFCFNLLNWPLYQKELRIKENWDVFSS